MVVEKHLKLHLVKVKNIYPRAGKFFSMFHLVIWPCGLDDLSFLLLDKFFAEGVSSEKETQVTGIYDLVAVLTHKGRSADSGHYVAWVKQENGQLSLMNSTSLAMGMG